MSDHSPIDRESFQTFLANAFAVQQSGLDDASVAALIEIQQFIASNEFELDGAMRMIADRALRVCSASGVAIALLEGNTLVYRSGSGRAAQDVGRRVPAVLSVSSSRELREILRVENAKTDARIEAYVCRQFGAMALLMLPIWKDHVLAGVLQVLFDDAHSFDGREVRTYGLMVGALEYGMRQHAHTPDLVPAQPRTLDGSLGLQSAEVVESTAEQLETPAATDDGLVVSQPQLLRSDPDGFAPAEARNGDEAISVRLSALVRDWTSAIQAKVGQLRSVNLWPAGAAIGAAIMLSVSGWIFHRTHSLSPELSVPIANHTGEGIAVKPFAGSESTASEAPKGFVLEEEKGIVLGGDWKAPSGSIPGFVRVRIGPNEVDYVSADVTIREFGSPPPKARNRPGMKQADFGEDVTVRYFANTPLSVAEKPSSVGTTPTTDR